MPTNITDEDCEALLRLVRARLRGSGWEAVDELATYERLEGPEIVGSARGRLIAYLQAVRDQVSGRSRTGLQKVIARINRQLAGEARIVDAQVMPVRGHGGDKLPDGTLLSAHLPSFEQVQRFMSGLMEIELLVLEGRFPDEPDERNTGMEMGPDVTPFDP